MRLTDMAIRALKLPDKGVRIVHDDLIPGFGVRVVTTSEERKTEIIRQASVRRYGPQMLFKSLEERRSAFPLPELLASPWERATTPSLSIAESE